MFSISNILARVFLGVQLPKQIGPSAVTKQAVHIPSKRSFAINQQKSFGELALDARETLDLGYKNTGRQPSASFSVDDWLAVGLGTLPRRGLFAIVSNHGERFSALEIAAAKSRMEYLHKNAIHAVNPFRLEHRRGAMLKASVRYMEIASSEEKSSPEWSEAMQMAEMAYATWKRSESYHAEGNAENMAA